MSEIYKILVVNPGSTSTKLGLFENEKLVAEKKIAHSSEEISRFPTIIDQVDFRRKFMIEFLEEQEVSPDTLSAVVGRGGLLKPLPSGTYEVDENIINDLKSCKYGEHASNIGGLLAQSFKNDFSVPAFIVDPPVVDELQDIARYSGLSELPRKSIWHALNVMAVTRHVCREQNLEYNKTNFVVAHLGGGISVSAIQGGKCIDVSNGLEEGPFTPERAGALPTLSLVELCFSGKYTKQQIKKMLVGKGGMVNYLGSSDMQKIGEMADAGDEKYVKLFEAIAYQIGKTIGSYVAVLKGKVDKIILTGGAAHNEPLVRRIQQYISNFAPVHVVPGEDELSALALGGLRILQNQSKPRKY